jgi:hypothetical protein
VNRNSILVASFLILQFSGFAYAQTKIIPLDFVYPAPHFRNIVEDAARIARVRITGREPLHGDAINLTPVCAYMLSATVVKAFKGGDEPFKFISAFAADFPDFSRDYLVITNFQPGVSQATQFALGELTSRRDVTSGQMACLLRQLSRPGYYVPSMYQTSWQFDKEAHEKFGGEWIAASARGDGIFCGLQAKEYLANDAGHIFEIKQLGKAERERYVVGWSGVERLLSWDATRAAIRFPCE